MKRAFKVLFPLLIFSLIILVIFFIPYKHLLYKQNDFYKTHIQGGFSIDTPERAARAATDGIQVVFQYGQSPSESSVLGQELQSLQIKVIDGYISSYLYYYECHRTKTVKPPPSGQEQYCRQDNHPYLIDENTLLASIAAHLKQVRDNQLIIGYWVLDDWVPWDAGSARQLLIKIRQLIQQYTPGRPAICGFGGYITSDHTDGWSDWIADNFSPQGCNQIGLYIYTPPIPNTSPTPPFGAYDWSMSTVLPAMFTSLQHRGWNITKEPLIGIAQAFGGPITHADSYWITPTARDIEIQSKSFCEHGAMGLTFYAWNDSKFGPKTQTPMNNTEIEMGIRNGIAACRQYWSNHPHS
jgi:hypothetical protein